MSTPAWLAIIDDEISLWLNPRVLAQIDLDTKGLVDVNEIVYRVNSQELLQVLASSVGMSAHKQGAIAIWTYYTEKKMHWSEVNASSNSPSPKPSPILRTLMSIDGDLSQKVCADIFQHPQADRLFKTHSFLISQISQQFMTAIADYVEEKLRPFAIATVSFFFTITWCEPLQNLAKQFKVPESLIAPLTNQCLAIAIAAPIVVLMIWWIYSQLNLKLPTLPKVSQKFFTNLLQLLENQFFRLLAIAVVIILFLCWVVSTVVMPTDTHVHSFIITLQSYAEPYLPVATISLRKGIISGLGKIFFRYPFFVKLIFGRFIR